MVIWISQWMYIKTVGLSLVGLSLESSSIVIWLQLQVVTILVPPQITPYLEDHPRTDRKWLITMVIVSPSMAFPTTCFHGGDTHLRPSWDDPPSIRKALQEPIDPKFQDVAGVHSAARADQLWGPRICDFNMDKSTDAEALKMTELKRKIHSLKLT